jgi:hypothetical protein
MADASWNFTLNIDEISHLYIKVDVIKITIYKNRQGIKFRNVLLIESMFY